MKILAIDAWRDSDGGWTWNAWYTAGTINKAEFEALKTNRQIIKWFRENGYLTEHSKGKVTIEDDQYNKVVCRRGTYEPFFAIEYGPEY